MKFTLHHTNKRVLKEVSKRASLASYRGQKVATGIISLGIALPIGTATTVAVLQVTNQVFETIDPFDKFSRSELVDTDEYQGHNTIVPLGYDYQDTMRHLEDLLSDIE